MVRIVQDFGDLANGESEAQQFLDAWQIRVECVTANALLQSHKLHYAARQSSALAA